MDEGKIIYSLSIEDILTVMEDDNIKLKLSPKDIDFIEEKVGDIIDWRGAILSALYELKEEKNVVDKKAQGTYNRNNKKLFT